LNSSLRDAKGLTQLISPCLFKREKHNNQIDIGGWAKLSLSGTAKQGDGTEVIAEGIASGLKKITEDFLHFG
jgi:hypothetical protein